MQNPIQKFRQNFIVFEKPGILSKKSKILTSSNYPAVQYFLLKLHTRFLQEGERDFFLFRPWVICKN